MIEMKKIITLAALVLAAAGCEKNVPATDSRDTVYLSIAPGISAGITPATAELPSKTSVGGTAFPAGSAVGISIFKAGSFDHYDIPGYHNIRSEVNYTQVWTFKPTGAASSTSKIGVFRNKGPIDIYGFYPYRSDIDGTNIDAIPFTVGTTEATNLDYMYASPVRIDPAQPSVPVVTPSFNHAMTLLSFVIYTSYTGPMQLKYIRLDASDNIFGLRGTYNAADIDGTVSVDPGDRSNTLTVSFNKNISTSSNSSCDIIIPEVSVTADDETTMTVTMIFDADVPLHQGGGSYTFNLREIVTRIGVENKCGFIKGYQYTFGVKIDNFVKYSGYPTITGWTDSEQPEIIF